MGSRSTGRKLAMQALYQADLRNEDIENIVEDFLIASEYADQTKNWAIELVRPIWENLEELDKIIQKYAIGWKLERINHIDRNILRIAFHELSTMKTDIGIVINEAVELAKKYSTDESPKFINGILGNYVDKECLQESQKK
jgi:transcription antitermination protein NusB